MALEFIYLWVGLFGLGLFDLYLNRYPFLHPLVLIPPLGWLWGDWSGALVAAGMVELIFGLAYFSEERKLTLILFASGLTVFINQSTHNINLILSLTIALLLAVLLESGIKSLQEWQKCLILFAVSGALVFIVPLGEGVYGQIPAQFLNQVAVAGGILPWIFFAYAIIGWTRRGKQKEMTLAIPAILVGSVLTLKIHFWGPAVYLVIYYSLYFYLKGRELPSLPWIELAMLVLGVYVLMPNLALTTFGVFAGVLLLNLLLVARKFAPIEIYLLIFIAGIILSRGGLLY